MFSSHGVVRWLALTAAGVAVSAVAACGGGGGEQAGGQWEISASATPSASATGKPRLAKITSACKLLPAKTVVKLLGSGSNTELEAREQPVEKETGETSYSCGYGRGEQEPFGLTVSSRTDQAGDAKATIDAIAEASGAKTTRVDEVGEDGVGYVKQGFRVVAVALPYEEDLRLVIFAAPEIVPHKKLVEVIEHVAVQV